MGAQDVVGRRRSRTEFTMTWAMLRATSAAPMKSVSYVKHCKDVSLGRVLRDALCMLESRTRLLGEEITFWVSSQERAHVVETVPIDDSTEIPVDLFDTLLEVAEDVKSGQHVLRGRHLILRDSC